MSWPFRYLVFKGGGCQGIAYAGTMEVLESRGVMNGIKTVCGASAGAIIAVLVALGYTAAEIKDLLWKTNFRSFLDGSWWTLPFRPITRPLQFIFTGGWYSGNCFHQWMRSLVKAKTNDPDCTFTKLRELAKNNSKIRELYLIATNISRGISWSFSHEAEHRPDTPIALAARMSMSIPVMFSPIRFKGDLMVDGGVLRNYPDDQFDQSAYIESLEHVEVTPENRQNNQEWEKEHPKETSRDLIKGPHVRNNSVLGVAVTNRDQIRYNLGIEEPLSKKLRSMPVSLARTLVDTVTRGQIESSMRSGSRTRTIFTDIGSLKYTDFKISDPLKEWLVGQGRDAATSFLNWFETKNQPGALLWAPLPPEKAMP